MNQTQIIIADDDPSMVTLLERHLGKAGYAVSSCSNGDDAFDLVTGREPVILLADWEMPGMTGVELCRKLRASKPDDAIYVILLTCNGEPEQVLTGFEAGADDFLVKPARSAELLARIRAGERVLKLLLQKRNDAEALQSKNADLEGDKRGNRRITIAAAVVGMLAVTLAFCSVLARHGAAGEDHVKQKELLIYCGTTMIKPMSEIARVVEEQEGCKIIITKGGSGNLLRAIKVNNVGDLYLPGSDSYIKTCQDEGLVSESVHVGYNKAALMVQKGNPKGITNDLENLASPDHYVVICNPNSGSIGRETKKILERRGIFDEVAKNALKLTTDSKDLVKVLKNKEADVVVNWYATSTWSENRPYVDALSIDGQYASKKKLVLGLLTFSKHPDIARKFMAYAASEKGRSLFEQYGLFDVE